MRKQKILYFSALSQMAGAEKSLYDIIRFISKDNNFEIGVILPYPGEFSKKLKHLNVRIFFLSKKNISPIKKIFLYPINLFKIIKEFKPDILHSNTKACIKYILLSRLFLTFKWIQHIRGNLIEKDNKIYHKAVIKFTDYRIGISKSVKMSYDRLNDKKFFILYNAFDFSNFPKKLNNTERQAFKRRLNLLPDKKIVLNVGRFTPIKKQETLIKVAKVLKNMEFIFIGNNLFSNKFDEKYYKKIRFMAQSLKNVHLLGWQNGVHQFYSIADLYVHTSETEAFGRVLIEAIYYKVPVIGRDCTGIKEVLKNGNVGTFFNGTESDLINKIMDLLKNYPDDNELSRRKEIILKEYNLKNYVYKLKKIYEKAIK